MHPEVAAMPVSAVEAYRKKHQIKVSDNKIRPIFKFGHVDLSDTLMKSLSNFDDPTPIQAQAWPPLLMGLDVIGIAKTGSGKTLGFCLPGIIHSLKVTKDRPMTSSDPGPIVLAIAPTRELAQQTDRVLKDLNRNYNVPIKSVCVFGGGSQYGQVAELRRQPHFVIATPGRLLAFLREGKCKGGRVSYFILDEADRMLDMGFQPDIREINSYLPNKGDSSKRQTLMFSATWPKVVKNLAKEFLRSTPEPFVIRIGKDSDELNTNRDITQIVEVIDDNNWKKDKRLVELLRKYHASKTNKIIIFGLYKKDIPRIETNLHNEGWKAIGMSSNRSQAQRNEALASFKSGETPLLVATDVAARGLDIPQVTHVINYSFPLTIEDYVHRIGRTGRAGLKGISHTFFTQFDKGLAGELQMVLKNAEQEIPKALADFGCVTKRKKHAMYGLHYNTDTRPMKKATRVTF